MTTQLTDVSEENGISDEYPSQTIELTGRDAKLHKTVSTFSAALFTTGLLKAVALAVLADFLFWKQPVGWTAALFGAALGGVILFSHRDRLHSGLRRTAGPLAVLLTSVLACTLHSTSLGIMTGVAGLAGVAIAVQSDRLLPLIQWITAMAQFWTYAGILSFYEIGNQLRGQLFLSALLKRQVKVWLAAIGLAVVFLALFAMANPVLEVWLKKLGCKLAELDLNMDFDMLLRAGQFLVFGLFAWALMHYRCSECAAAEGVKEPPTLPVNFTDVCLILFNLVFAVQSILDIGYLFSGMVLPGGMTYAEYAHRGFYPLWAAAMLAGGFMLLFWSDDAKKFPPSRLRNSLLFIWIAQNALLLFSAIYRMHLYVCAYSLTHLRVAALAGMVLVLAGLIGITVRILLRKRIGWLLNMNGCAILAVILVLTVADVSSRIAWFNVKHCKESSGRGMNLDVRYLNKLGEESLPALVHFVQKYPESPDIDYARRTVKKLVAVFEADAGNWRSWNLSRYRISRLIKTLPPAEPEDKRSNKFDREKYDRQRAIRGEK